MFPHYSTISHLESPAILHEMLQTVLIPPLTTKGSVLYSPGLLTLWRVPQLGLSGGTGYIQLKECGLSISQWERGTSEARKIMWSGVHMYGMPSNHSKHWGVCSKTNHLAGNDISFTWQTGMLLLIEPGHFQQSQTEPTSSENILLNCKNNAATTKFQNNIAIGYISRICSLHDQFHMIDFPHGCIRHKAYLNPHSPLVS